MFYTQQNLQDILKIVEACRGVLQKPEHHPEGDVFVHSLQVYAWAKKESKDVDLIVAALVHDVGKQVRTHGHDKYSVELLDGLISEKTMWLGRNPNKTLCYVPEDITKNLISR